jgi:hypothetical protein
MSDRLTDLHDGWPPDGELGDFFGFDAEGTPAVLRWEPENSRWLGLRFCTYEKIGVRPECFIRGDDTESWVVKWARA